jgi:D-hexose-6-phosphate mutarotase
VRSLVQASLPPSVHLVQAGEGLPRLDVASPHARAQVFCHGAQLTQWTPDGAERGVIWTSARSYFRPDKAIRGGVPVCFPWFGPHPSNAAQPAHGFARLADWALRDASEDAGGAVTLVFVIESDDTTRASWPHDFHVTLTCSIGRALDMALRVENRGGAPFTFEEALHTYFAVGDIRQVAIAGLEDAEYLDKVLAFARHRQPAEPLRFTGETDRVYLDTTADCFISDPAWQRRIAVGKRGSRTTVVWNPWIDRARALTDFGDDEWQAMVCVESANVGAAAVRLEPGGVHTMSVVIGVEPLSAE